MTVSVGLTAAPDVCLLDEIASAMDLREPNRDAIHTVALRLYEHTAAASKGFFEGVVDSATGMGKSFVIAGAIEYFAQQGGRNFAIVTPGSTIQGKTINQFTAGHPKSLIGGMSFEPTLVHAGNFQAASVASDFADPETVKLYVFTVQSLLKPGSKQGRKTHEFQEGLGGPFYEHLDALEDLIIFADEHHCYGGPKFSDAVRGLTPLALVGLTATPDERKLKKEGVPIVFRYPLAAAIKDRFVKTPVVVGRRDDRTDERTQLLDGVALLTAKEGQLANYAAENPEDASVHPIMLVSCQEIAHAKETVAFLRSDQCAGGRFAGEDVVLEVHSDQKEAALAALDQVEDAGSPTRIIVQVGMLKEGWDVKNVYVITSLRSSISEVLTEQTLGRGLRLPFGSYVEDEFQLLNELEVVAHERYTDLLRRAGKLTQEFVDHRTQLVEEAGGEDATEVPVSLPVTVEPGAAVPGEEGRLMDGDGARTVLAGAPANEAGTLVLGSVEEQITKAEQAAAPRQPLKPRKDLPKIEVPRVVSIPVPGSADLTSVTDAVPFRELGRRLAVDPEQFLARSSLEGEVDAADRTARLVTKDAETKVAAAVPITTREEGQTDVITRVVQSSTVASRRGAFAQVERLLGWVLEGAGKEKQQTALLTRYPDRVAVAIVRELSKQLSAISKSKTQINDVVNAEPFAPRPRLERPRTSADRYGKFTKGVAYTGWGKGLFEQAWFDSSPERDLATILDNENTITVWVRLHLKDLPILWDGADREYNPDFLALDIHGTQWILEVKDDRHMNDATVQAKRQAALSWANAVNGPKTYGVWEYLLISESDLKAAKGSWKALVASTRA